MSIHKVFSIRKAFVFRKHFFISMVILLPSFTSAQLTELPPPKILKKLTVEELMNIEVISVSKEAEKLSDAASAIQVLTNEDIRRSGAIRLPQALRLASNLQVARANGHDWAITSRGFNSAVSNTSLANKLLVMIDGRSVYTPLFGGVFWDVQNVFLEDIDRIEVISGPGGTLWGANAVNGVINIISKNSRETTGAYISNASGSFLNDYLAFRYGAKLGDGIYSRFYLQNWNGGSLKLKDNQDANDAWKMYQRGFRIDIDRSHKNKFMIQGDFYNGEEDTPINTIIDGQNILSKWTHIVNDSSQYTLQFYADRTWRELRLTDFNENLITFDLDFEHHFFLTKSQKILWGTGYRFADDNVKNSQSISFLPAEKYLHLFTFFVQDQIRIVPEKLSLTIGTKILHNDYTDFEIQPSVRLSWMPKHNHTIWTAVSRAVRTPSRFDADAVSVSLKNAGKNFRSEKVKAFELGYRVRFIEKVSVSIAGYYNLYNDIRSINYYPAPTPTFIFANDQKADAWGFEFASNIYFTEWWRIRLGYSYLDNKFTSVSADVVPFSMDLESIDPKQQFKFQSIMDLPKGFGFDVTGRYVDKLQSAFFTTDIPSYFTFDARISWHHSHYELAVVGNNLAEKSHIEFANRLVPRNITGRLTLRF
jgi:iron complex outermembrane recepter protein